MMSMAVTMHPIWQSGGIILVVCVVAAMLLQVLVHRFLPVELRREHIGIGAPIFSVIGTTYAVLLAFMATTAWDQYSAAQALARHEADLVGSIYRASHGIADPAGAAMRAVQSFLIAAVSEVMTARRDRRLATHGDIPSLVWMVLLCGGALVVGFSFVFGAQSLALHLLMTAALVASGVLVLLLIVGLSSPFHGAVTIPPDAYAGVLAEMTPPP